MKLCELETPALVLDLDLLEQNMAAMSKALEGGSARLRPHFKSNKCTAIAKRQMAAGAKGITCAKLGEAEVLVEAGIPDILIANQIVQPSKLMRLAYLARRARITVCVDNDENIDALSRAAQAAGSVINVYIEYEAGMNRCGARTEEAVLRLAEHVKSAAHLHFGGIQSYAGNLSHVEDENERVKGLRAVEARLKSLKEYLEAHGVAVEEISGASTATAAFKAHGGVYTELQAGSYLFMDSSYGACSLPFAHALTVRATVISLSEDHVTVDVGVKNLTMDQHAPVLAEDPSCALHFSEEHTDIRGLKAPKRLGDQVELIPGHCCTTVNTFDAIYVKRGGEIVEKWPIEGRGRSV